MAGRTCLSCRTGISAPSSADALSARKARLAPTIALTFGPTRTLASGMTTEQSFAGVNAGRVVARTRSSAVSSSCVGCESVASAPDAPPTDDAERERRRAFVAEHRTAVFGYPRRDDGPSMSVVYYVMDGDDRILVSTMRDRGKAK